MSKLKRVYCPVIANCEAPYQCIDRYCRIGCKADKDCPNKWKCGTDSFCMDGNYLSLQRKAVSKLARTGDKVIVEQPKIITSLSDWASTVAGIFFSILILGCVVLYFWKTCRVKDGDVEAA